VNDALKKRLLALDKNGKPTFAYRKAAETNVAATFARIKRAMKEAEKQPSANVKKLERKLA
jgi:hypothetical protein